MRWKSMPCSLLLLVSLLVSPFTSPLGASEGTVLYRLEKGSTLLDDCLICGRPSIELPLEGTFLLTLEMIGDVTDRYRVEAVDLRTSDRRYLVSGSGSYLTRLGEGGVIATQALSLEVTINGEAGIKLESGEVKPDVALPAFDIQVEEQTSSQVRVFTLHLIASVVEGVAYEALPGSVFVDDCLNCKRLVVPRPLAGGFFLTKIDEDPLFATYRLYGIDLRNAEAQVEITGFGTYSIGGEVALLQEMTLEVAASVGGTTRDPVVLTSGGKVGMLGRQFPEIEIQVDEKDPPDINHIYKVHLVARPSAVTSPPFRRGDSNGDGASDLSDAVHVLTWLFVGGDAPACLEASDVDGSDAIDLSDAVYLLNYLFLSGQEPPAPGPTTCGQGAKPLLACASYPSCLPAAR
jgi:hypothetical protein